MMQRPPGNGMLTASPTSIRHPAPRSLGVRPILPDRNVSADTIEEAYVSFVFYCNPAVPFDTDTAALREAFRTPPKSGGKSFSTFTLFDLVRRFESKEIKTWAELALRLGVEPPDQDKGQSSQKIQQYAVRLKRWMHSMHVDAFFEYLLNNPHPYWTQVPTDPNPVNELGRDGVAAEDDMALRALLPQIRPRRGRKRPDDDEVSKSPSQRPRLESPMNTNDFTRGGVEPLDLWSAHPDNRASFFTDGFMRLNSGAGQPTATSWTGQDISQTPLTAYPQSAITPSTRNAFWTDPTEPKSAITPQKSKIGRRHGAKVVSSAWRSGGPGGTGKTRGRPPINRTSNDGSLSAFPQDSPTSFKEAASLPMGMQPNIMTPTSAIAASPQTCPAPTPNMGLAHAEAATQSHDPRPPRSRLSLQVPQRVGGEVRLATPPPVVMVNGQATPVNINMGMEQSSTTYIDYSSVDMFGQPGADPFTGLGPADDTSQPGVHFQNLSDRTNMDEVESLFIYEIVSGDWYDGKNNRIPPCSVDEAAAIVAQVLENVMRKASTRETFLINIAALTGGTIMKTTSRLQCYRLQETAEETHYICRWELRLGDIRGQFSMRETLRHDRWKRPASAEDDSINLGGADDGSVPLDESARHWQQKFRNVLDVLKKKDEELAAIRRSIMQSINVKRPEDIR